MDNFFATVAQTGTYKDLFLSNVGFVNKDTAPIYGLDASKYGTSLTQVQLDANQRPGFMTRLGFLSSYSHYSDTSPILRGAFIVIYMLGVNVPPPPPGAAMTPQPPGNYTTNRDKVDRPGAHERHVLRRVPHQRHQSLRLRAGELRRDRSVADGRPAGRSDRRGRPPSTSATAPAEDVTTPLQLMQGIAASPAGQATYAQYWVSFAYGRDPNPQDQCVADQIATSIGGGQLPHPQHPLRPHPSGLVQHARPCNSLTADEEPRT